MISTAYAIDRWKENPSGQHATIHRMLIQSFDYFEDENAKTKTKPDAIRTLPATGGGASLRELWQLAEKPGGARTATRKESKGI